MILPALIGIPLAAGLAAWLAGRAGSGWPRWVALAGLSLNLALSLTLLPHGTGPQAPTTAVRAERHLVIHTVQASRSSGLPSPFAAWSLGPLGAREGFGPALFERSEFAGRLDARLSGPCPQVPVMEGLRTGSPVDSQKIIAPLPATFDRSWIPGLGIRFHLAADGLSLVLILLTHFLGLVAVACSWTEISERTGFFFFNLMAVLAGIIGVFTAYDLFLFYFFWELMMVPMFLMIAIWGHARRIYAAIKFFLFTQVSGLLMLAAIVGLYLVHGRATGDYTFDYPALLGTALPDGAGRWLMGGFLIAFAVKLPAFPVHSWLPDAHTEAPTAGSVILAGLLLKTGAYGMLRFVIPLFPVAARAFAPAAMALAVIAILYGAWLAFSQTDIKRLVAYTSISHMGFVLLAVFAWNTLALQGAVIQIVCHGVSTGALFVLAGILQERLQTREMGRMGGLWTAAPRLGAMALVFALASLGLPGMGNFIGEFLILLGAYPVSPLAAALAALGLVGATVYALWMVQQAFHGARGDRRPIRDLTAREIAPLAAMLLVLLWLGLYPQPVFRMAGPALHRLEQNAPVMRMSDKIAGLSAANENHRPVFKAGAP